MGFYRTKPCTIEAIKFLNRQDSIEALTEFIAEPLALEFGEDGGLKLYIHTPEGRMEANPGDWIVKGTEGEFYPCKDVPFQKKYEEI
jgi:hypothetical protein